MRVTFSAQYQNGIANIESAADRLAEFQRQVSSGKRLDRVSVDPAAATSAINERGNLAQIDQYSRTGDSAYARLTVIDTVMSDIITKLTTAQQRHHALLENYSVDDVANLVAYLVSSR